MRDPVGAFMSTFGGRSAKNCGISRSWRHGKTATIRPFLRPKLMIRKELGNANASSLHFELRYEDVLGPSQCGLQDSAGDRKGFRGRPARYVGIACRVEGDAVGTFVVARTEVRRI